ncbi:hypothetical protein [Dactylosporangium matsuzakiense]|uniref:Uncharacterized protein n=1 Tax=Dactylosporangium matsuzakiense TaxID=53360 RepID=A0A9W6KKU1_9ACTN|nr:hypothetical protein [Dactylosporangium matsuzakiense]UWZ48667.1 hypothetical protein Dmats_21020 [Dactylosporangium matsuzakiense]GLL03033.1 hypothetical protein GCM10017581_047760 [Dactylosporangium matsuzakiense]
MPPGVHRAAGRSGFAGLSLQAPSGGYFYLSEVSAGDFHPNTTYAGVPVQDDRDGATAVIGEHTFVIEAAASGLPRDALLHVLTGIRLSPATTDPLVS